MLAKAGALLGLAAGMTGANAATSLKDVQAAATPYLVAPRVERFALRDVRLLDGPFKRAQETDRAYLLRLDPDRFLHHLRKVAGLAPKAPPYGGWDTEGAGMVGHYLTACAQMAEATGDPTLKKRVAYLVSEMAACQQANGDGGLYPAEWDRKTYFPSLLAARPELPPVTPWYVVHKIMAGLRDAYLLCGDMTARNVLIKQCDWCVAVTSRLSAAQWQQMLNGEHGGPHEVLADVYALTGDRKYLDCARKFRHDRIFDPLAHNDDAVLNTVHANTQIPKFIAYERIYETSGDLIYHDAARNFWRKVVANRSWVNGGDSQWEAFFPPEDFPEKINEVCGPETCNTYNMLKLTRQLYLQEPSAAYVDYYERALYNHILSSQDPEHGGFVYYTSMRPGHYRVYSRDDDAMWCCVGTGMENHGKYGEMIYAHAADRLYVNLFIASEVAWKAKGLTLRQETAFPEKPVTTLRLTLRQPQKIRLQVRVPQWIEPGRMQLRVNGVLQKSAAAPGSYAAIDRVWKSGDTVAVSLPMRLTTVALPHSRAYVAFLYGPILLAGPLGAQGLTPADFHTGGPGDAQLAKKVLPVSAAPTLVGDLTQAVNAVKSVPGQPLAFRTQGLALPHDVSLVPFYQIHEQRYAIYWRIVNRGEYATERAKIGAEEREAQALESRTVDRVRSGEQQPEADHNLQGEGTRAGDAGYPFTHWRDATGWFSYDVKTRPDKPLELRCAYWGSDNGRTFDVLVNGVKIATQRLTGTGAGNIFVTYTIPPELTRGKSGVTVRFQAAPGSLAGGLFDLRVLTAP